MISKLPKECIDNIILYSGFLSMIHLSQVNKKMKSYIDWLFRVRIRACPKQFFNDRSKQTMKFMAKISDRFEFNNIYYK